MNLSVCLTLVNNLRQPLFGSGGDGAQVGASDPCSGFGTLTSAERRYRCEETECRGWSTLRSAHFKTLWPDPWSAGVRAAAVDRIAEMPAGLFTSILPQLVQALKYEMYHDR